MASNTSRGIVKILRNLPFKQSSDTFKTRIIGGSCRRYCTTLSAPIQPNESNAAIQKCFITSKQNVRQISTSGSREVNADALADSDGIEVNGGDFNNFGISEETQRALRAHGIEKLFPVQTMGYKYIMAGKDVVVKARTGTGKTLAFALPLVEKLLDRKKKRGDPPKVIVLTPTRELATQVEEHTKRLNKKTRICCVYGGASYRPQEIAIQSGLDVVVGTPGRLKDMIEKGILNLQEIEHVILDEVDRMLDMGFQDIVDQILGRCYHEAHKPQTLLFSATVPSFVRQAAKKYLSDDVLLIDLIGEENIQSSTLVKQMALHCNSVSENLLRALIRDHGGVEGKTIVFCETKLDCHRISQYLTRGQSLHGDVPQAGRTKVINDFKIGRLNTLVTTDVAARGLDIPNVDLVIQIKPPNDVDNFIHRTGRTGRAGKEGKAIMIYDDETRYMVKQCEKVANTRLIQIPLPGNDLQVDINHAISKLKKMNAENAVELCGEQAEALMAKFGGVESLSAALVLLSNCGNNLGKSLLTARMGYRTFTFESEQEKVDKSSFEEALRGCDVEGLCVSNEGKTFAFDVHKDQIENLEVRIKENYPDGKLTKHVLKLPKGVTVQVSSHNEHSFRNSESSYGDRSPYGRSKSYGSRSFGDRSRPRYGGRSSYEEGYESENRSNYGDRYGYGNKPRYGNRFEGRSRDSQFGRNSNRTPSFQDMDDEW